MSEHTTNGLQNMYHRRSIAQQCCAMADCIRGAQKDASGPIHLRLFRSRSLVRQRNLTSTKIDKPGGILLVIPHR